MKTSSWIGVCGLSVLLAACGAEVDPARGALTGTVSDAIDGTPIAGAYVRVEGLEAGAWTDETGSFRLERVPQGTHSVLVGREGYFDVTRLNVPVRAGLLQDELLQLFPVAPSDEAVDAHLRGIDFARTLRDDPNDPALRPEVAAFLRGEIDALPGPDLSVRAEGEVAGTRVGLGSPPATIRLWRRSIDGASASCSGRIDIIDFEDYVKGVLPHEWISSWREDSLTAGSLAIRTYSWNWIARGGKYDCADLDDTTRSQVYRDDRLDVTNRAVDRTRGQAITRAGAMVSGEYSAENSSPTADGVDDPLCAGRELYGHGRGMCQWGSQRWATDGRDYTWIATHYWPGSIIEGGAPAAPAYAATFTAKDHPAEMISGERAVAWIEFRNDGTAAWSLTDTRVGTTLPNDHASPFYDAENWINDHRASGADHSDYGRGAVGRFTFMITAPEVAADTTVTDTFGLVQEGVTWFGPDDVRFEVLVHPRVVTPTDADGDGSPAGTDCDDADPARRPGGSELCGDAIDQDCDGADVACDPGTDPGPDPDPGPGPDPDPAPGTDPEPEPDPGPGGAPVVRHGGMVSGGCSTAGTRPAGQAALPALLAGLALLLATRRRRG